MARNAVEGRSLQRANLFEQIREEERLKREAKEESLSSSVRKKPSAKGAISTRGQKKRQTARTGGRSKG